MDKYFDTINMVLIKYIDYVLGIKDFWVPQSTYLFLEHNEIRVHVDKPK